MMYNFKVLRKDNKIYLTIDNQEFVLTSNEAKCLSDELYDKAMGIGSINLDNAYNHFSVGYESD